MIGVGFLEGIVVILALAVLWRMKLNISGFGDGLSLDNTYAVRGVLAVLIVLHHLSRELEGGLVVLALKNVGVLCVALFLFFSGYGLHRSYVRKPHYAKTILTRRIPSVAAPYLVFILLYWGFSAAAGAPYTGMEVLASLVNGKPIVSYSWYILCILVFYGNYWLSALVFRKRFGGLVAWHFLFAAVWVLLCRAWGYEEYWYNAAISFPLGIFWAAYEEKLTPWVRKHYALVLLLSFALFGGSYALALVGMKRDVYVSLFWLACTGFLVFMVLVLMKCTFGSPVLRFLGQISFELYGIHGLVMMLFRQTEAPLPRAAAVLGVSIGAAWLLHRCFQWLLGKCLK